MLRSFEAVRQQASAPVLGRAHDPLAVLLEGAGCYRALGIGQWHWHDCAVLLIPRVGAVSLRHEDDRNITWITQDEFLLLPSGRAHRSHPMLPRHSHSAIYISDDALHRIEQQIGALTRLQKYRQRVVTFPLNSHIRTVHELCRGESPSEGCDLLIQKKLGSTLLLHCLAQIERFDPTNRNVGYGEALVSEIKAFVTARCTERISLDEIAWNFRISRRHATRLFRKYTGSSMADFQLRAQIDNAHSLLAKTDRAVSEIAYKTGFQSGSALARAMRRLDGVSPTEIRNAPCGTKSSRSHIGHGAD